MSIDHSLYNIVPLKWSLVASSYVPCWWSSFFDASHLAGNMRLMSQHFEISQTFPDHQLQITKSSSHFCGSCCLWTDAYITWCRSLHTPEGLTVKWWWVRLDASGGTNALHNNWAVFKSLCHSVKTGWWIGNPQCKPESFITPLQSSTNNHRSIISPFVWCVKPNESPTCGVQLRL